MKKVDVILGLQWGDEGKGKIVDSISPKYDVVARFQGGPNAGHSLKFDGDSFVMHTVPSGIFREGTLNIIGNGVVVDPAILMDEVRQIEAKGVDVKSKLLISKRANLILPTHRILDGASESAMGKGKIGSTLKGIGPAYMDKTGRYGLRIGDILLPDFKDRYEALKQRHLRMLTMYPDYSYDLAKFEGPWLAAIEELKQFRFIESERYVNDAMNNDVAILAEGAQGSLLDIDFGTYPFVTSSNPASARASASRRAVSATSTASSRPTAPASATGPSRPSCSMRRETASARSAASSVRRRAAPAAAAGSTWSP